MIAVLLARPSGHRRRPDEPPARPTRDEATAIARGAVTGHWSPERLIPLRREVEGGRLLWKFRTATIGSSLEVEVDDATGEPTVRWFGGC